MQTIVTVIEGGQLLESRLVKGDFDAAKAWLADRDVYDSHVHPEHWKADAKGFRIRSIRYSTGEWVDIYLREVQ